VPASDGLGRVRSVVEKEVCSWGEGGSLRAQAAMGEDDKGLEVKPAASKCGTHEGT
jgi:hypothetical protein